MYRLLLVAEAAATPAPVAVSGDILTGIITLAVALITGGGLVKLLEWWNQRQDKIREAGKEDRQDLQKEYSSFLGELRGEIHALRDRVHALTLQNEVCAQENGALKQRVHALEIQIGNLAAAGDIAIVTTDHSGNIIAWSPSATDLFGFTASEAIGKDVATLIVPEQHRGLHTSAMGQCSSEDRPPRSQPMIFRAHNKWGHEFLIDITLTGNKPEKEWFYTATIRRRQERFE